MGLVVILKSVPEETLDDEVGTFGTKHQLAMQKMVINQVTGTQECKSGNERHNNLKSEKATSKAFQGTG